jgi:D-alanyl-D-alanine carboxypeptidase (penicillin-binding protein 5/6)
MTVSIIATVPLSAFAKDKKPTAKSSILLCMDTKDVICEENAYEHLSPASVTKIMSILLIAEALDNGKIKLDDTVSASENAVSKGGSQIWLEVGESMSVEDLLKAVIISSANDACTLLSEYVAGSADAFVDKMNEKVKSLGLENSHFENCTGLDDEVTDHYSCAYDLAVIACEVMKYDIVKKYSTVWLDSLRDGKTELNNTNKLVNTYKGITGLKTGTTSNAGFCLCATAERDGMSLVSVVLGSPTSEERFRLCAMLLDSGFAEYKLKKIEPDMKKISPVKIKNGMEKYVKPSLLDAGVILVKKDTEKIELKYKVKDECAAPVKRSDILGEVIVSDGNKELMSLPLKAGKDIDKISFGYILYKLFNKI